jgi:tetratricopeptide (TPR) repeat protein
MKANLVLSFLFSSICLLLCKKTEAQMIRNDTIIVTVGAEVEIFFPSTPSGTLPQGDGSYIINKGGKKSLLLKALKKGAKPEPMEIIEDERKHEFVIAYADKVPTMRIDRWAKNKDLKAYVKRKDDNADKRLEAANQMYDQGMFEPALTEYKWLVWEVNKSKEGFVSNRIGETEMKIRETKENKYKDAMARGEKFASEKKYKEAIMAYDDAIAAIPGDSVAQIRRAGTNHLLFLIYKKNAEEAVASKNYIVAEVNYAEAKKVDPLSFVPNEKSYLNVIKNAKTQREKIGKERKYYTILATAKLLAAKAVTAQDYELAIQEYKTASGLLPDSKFPTDKIKLLTKMKKDLSAKK